MDYSTKTIKELKELLKQRGQKTTGKKIDLIFRLKDDDNINEQEKNRFKVFVRTLSGSIYTIYIDQCKTISELKYKIGEKIGCPTNKQILYFLCNEEQQLGDILYPNGTIGKKTKDDQILSSLGVNNESFFHLHVKLV